MNFRERDWGEGEGLSFLFFPSTLTYFLVTTVPYFPQAPVLQEEEDTREELGKGEDRKKPKMYGSLLRNKQPTAE